MSAWTCPVRRHFPCLPAAAAVLCLSPFAGLSGAEGLSQNPAAPWRLEAEQPPDFTDSLAVFSFLFHRLPDEIRVLPTENYYYWRLRGGGRELRGNFRLASGQREKGLLSFAAEEWRKAPGGETIRWARWLGAVEGVKVTCPDALSAEVEFQGKRVRFLLHAIPQLPPPPGTLAEDEAFIARTFDESGLPFYLCFHKPSRRFFWVLNEEHSLPESFHEPVAGFVTGRRSGFIFWNDQKSPRRKILAGVSRNSVRRNDEFDGPFDQLADNYAAQVPLRKYARIAFPELAEVMDQYGYLSGRAKTSRLAITGYFIYEKPEEVYDLLRLSEFPGSPVTVISAAGAR